MGETYEHFAEDKKKRNVLLSGLSGRPDYEITFENFDKLNLKGYGNNLLDVIRDCHMYPRSNDSKSYVIGLDAEWGSGKTTFLSMLYTALDREYVDGNNLVLPVYYNAWRGDFWNNAFEPFFDCIWNSVPDWCEALKLFDLAAKWNIKLTNREEAVIDSALEKDGKSAKLMAGHGLRASGLLIASYLAKPLTAEMDATLRKKTESEVGEVAGELMRQEKKTEDFFPMYAAFQNAVKKLQLFLEDLTIDERKVVIFIDELDRCRPDFAVQTLEVIKHMFDVDRLVFVLALDVNQLSNTVKKVYGNEFDSVGYLERYFNMMSMLPVGGEFNYREILNAVQEEIIAKESSEWDSTRGEFENEYKPYKWDMIKSDFAGIAQDFGLSLREYRRVLLNMHILEKTVLHPYLGFSMARVMYFYCLVIKYKYPVEFSRAVFKQDDKKLRDSILKDMYDMRNSMEYTDADIVRMRYIIDALLEGVNRKIDTIMFERFRRTNSYSQYDSAGLNERWEDMGESHISDKGNTDVCYSYILYQPDCSNLDEIKNMTLMKYIYRKLEMFDIDVGGYRETRAIN